MRLLQIAEDGKLSLVTFIGKDVPPYAILSHTWGPAEEEVSFADFADGNSCNKIGMKKIRSCARQTQEDGLKHFWVDTCCINKDSSAELSEAINSMYAWYRHADVCYAYLSDVHEKQHFGQSRWFGRGWTLQELLAPADVIFFDANWSTIGFKSSLKSRLSKITGIDSAALHDGTALSKFSVAERMSWASTRQTTRVEDEAYCLLGLFDINMPLIYGEGRKAFLRLQEELLTRFDDASIFAYVASRSSVPTTETMVRSHNGMASNVSEYAEVDHAVNEELIPDTTGLYSSSPTYYRDAKDYTHYPTLESFSSKNRKSDQPSLHMIRIANVVQLQVALWKLPMECLLMAQDHDSDSTIQLRILRFSQVRLNTTSIRKLRACAQAYQTGNWAIAFMNCRRRQGGIVGILLRQNTAQGVYVRQHFPSLVETVDSKSLKQSAVKVCTIFVEADTLTTGPARRIRNDLRLFNLLQFWDPNMVIRATNLHELGLIDVKAQDTSMTTTPTLSIGRCWRSPDIVIPVINIYRPDPGQSATCEIYPNSSTIESFSWRSRKITPLATHFVPTNRGSRTVIKLNEQLQLVVRTRMQWERRESHHHVDRLTKRCLLSLTVVPTAEHEVIESEGTILLEDPRQQSNLIWMTT